jgi:hypothetical protein
MKLKAFPRLACLGGVECGVECIYRPRRLPEVRSHPYQTTEPPGSAQGVEWARDLFFRSGGSILSAHGPSTRPRGTERTRSATPRRYRARREAADERCAADRGDGRNTRLHEGSCRWERRPHSRLHDDWLRGRRGHGRGANGGAGKPAILEAPRRRSRPLDDSGRTRSTLFECAAWIRTIGHAEKCVVDALIPAFNDCGLPTQNKENTGQTHR